MSYTHFTLTERKYLQELLAEGKNQAEIARLLGRAKLLRQFRSRF